MSIRLQNEDLSAIDYVFCWLGNANLLLAIIKLIEDKMNASTTSIRWGAVHHPGGGLHPLHLWHICPVLYSIIMQQSNHFVKEALNEHQKMLRMRGRPKILLAKTLEEAIDLHSLPKLIRLVDEPRKGAGATRCRSWGSGSSSMSGTRTKTLLKAMQSSDLANAAALADRLNVGFLHKYSKSLNHELRNFIIRNFAFGEFLSSGIR
ncbi:MAG: hypothetical protein R2751_17815 [Bacteroidales bacterium]